MKLYTKAGDGGETSLFGGARVSKASDRVSAYGTLDELNATLGLARTEALPEAVDAQLTTIQSDLFTLGAELATVPGKEDNLGLPLIGARDVTRLEEAIDASEAQLDPLRAFVLPGGSRGAACLHHARTVCRRAERELVALAAREPVRDVAIVYLNRLSDLLFSYARLVNHALGVKDVPWSRR